MPSLRFRSRQSSPITQTLLGDIYENMDRFDKAIAAYDRDPGRLRNCARMPRSKWRSICSVSNEADEAKDKLPRADRQAIRTNYDALVTLGNIYRANEEFAQAADAYGKAIALLEGARPLATGRSSTIAASPMSAPSSGSKAEADFRKALALEPDQPMVLNYLGYSMIEKGSISPKRSRWCARRSS